MIKNIIFCKSCKLFLITFITLVVLLPSSKEENNHVLEIQDFTDVKISKLKYTWTINNLKFCCSTSNDVIKSPTFSTSDGCNWYLHIRPKGETELDKNYVAVGLTSINCNANTAVEFSILNAGGKQTHIKKFSHQYKRGEVWGYSRYILQNDLYKEENNDLIPDNHLTIICEITITVGWENSLGKFAQPKSQLLEDFGRLLENEILTDITLTAGGLEFKAHKAILAARSPVFKTRLQDDINKMVEIPDMDPKTLGAMLRYIYTNEKVCNSPEVAPNLLAAAETFQLNGLKTMCENTLRSNLAIENAVDFYILADRYRAVELKKETKNFIIVHSSEIASTDGFKSLTLAQPRLATELFDVFG